jgi:anti-sigma-K factor RskA
MDKDTRNRIQRATQAARGLLEHEYAEQLEGLFDIRLEPLGGAPGGQPTGPVVAVGGITRL